MKEERINENRWIIVNSNAGDYKTRKAVRIDGREKIERVEERGKLRAKKIYIKIKC